MTQASAPATAPQGQFNADLRGVHYDFLKARVPAWFTQARVQRQNELGQHVLALPGWYRDASRTQKTALFQAHTRMRDSLNAVEEKLGAIQALFDFAEPLLKAAIKDKFALELDVRQVFFARKYAFKDRDDLYGVLVFDQQSNPSLNHKYRGQSLLEAALANFTADEAKVPSCTDCQIITRWSAYNGDVIATFEAVNSEAVAIAPHAFAALCRELDLGKQYQEHIAKLLQPADTTERAKVHKQIEDHHRERLSLSLEIATLQKSLVQGLSTEASNMLGQLIADQATINFGERPVTYAALTLFGVELVGPLLLGPARKGSKSTERVVVYLPNDPQQPLKEYASSADFMGDMRTRLHSVEYRRFFSRYVPLRHQGTVFEQFNRLYRPTGVSSSVDYSLSASPARLPLDEVPVVGNLWHYWRQGQIDKVSNDARAVAVPTDDEDRQARLDRLQGYLDAAVSVFNLAAFVVPGLGPLMLVVGAAQMCDEVFEGVEAYEQGDLVQMWAHLSSVALNVAVIGVGSQVLPNVRITQPARPLKAVTLENGQERLWHADLEPYKARINLAPGTQADELGLYSHQGRQYVALNGDYYQVRRDPLSGQYRIQHPSRSSAYAPELIHNGQGTWSHELEQPLSWSGVTLMRRLGPLVSGFTDTQLEQIRQVSGVDESALRRLHVEGEPLPAKLLDTLAQFRAYDDALNVERGIEAGALPNRLCSFAAALAVELPGWPAGKAIAAYPGSDLSGIPVKYGAGKALEKDTLGVTRTDLMTGQLPRLIATFLDEPQMDKLVGRYTARDPASRATAVRQRLQAQASQQRAELMRSVYTELRPSNDPAVALIQRDFKRLPTAMVRELLVEADPAERRDLAQRNRVPLGIAEQARRLQQQLRLAEAYEGLHLDELANEDTEALVLNSLKNLPGWRADLRLEVRDGSLAGEVRASFGAVDAAERKVLVRTGPGRYQAFDGQNESLHGEDNLYNSLQHALTDAHRSAIGLPHVYQGEQLKKLIVNHTLPRDELRAVLGMQAQRQPFFRTPWRWPGKRLGYPLSGRGRSTWRQILEERVRSLYPSMNEVQMEDYLRQQGTADDQWLKNLETEFKQLDATLNAWLRERPMSSGAMATRRRLRDLIRDAWRKSGEWDVDTEGRYRGQAIKLEDTNLGAHLASLPALPGNFDHVSLLYLPNCGISDATVRFLANFPRLRLLDLSGNALTRLPETFARMPWLEGLDLAENQIVLNLETANYLRTMHRLISLDVGGNPLGMPLDISRMPMLRWLSMGDCGADRWPLGLFGAPRPRGFLLDMVNNPLGAIPAVAPGSDRAAILARTVVSHELLTPQVRDTLSLYIESVGLDPSRRFPQRGTQDSAHWMSGLTRRQWQDNQGVWNSVEEAIGSEPFFNEIRKLTEELDKRPEDYRTDLTAKVWRMLDAMAKDAVLRDQLFEMAVAPTTCVDAGAQLFNAMGVEVLRYEAMMLHNDALVSQELLELAKGKARLDELGRIAHRRVGELLAEGRRFPEYNERGELIRHNDAEGNPLPSIDEVEIHLAYTTRLADDLELPWQTAMYFSESDVTDDMLTAARLRVQALEEGDLLREGIVEQPFWADYVQSAYAEEFDVVSAKNQALIDLYAAQQELGDNGKLSAQVKAELRQTIETSARVLGKPLAEASSDQVMSDEAYFSDVASLGEERTNVLRSITDRLLGRGTQNRK